MVLGFILLRSMAGVEQRKSTKKLQAGKRGNGVLPELSRYFFGVCAIVVVGVVNTVVVVGVVSLASTCKKSFYFYSSSLKHEK